MSTETEPIIISVAHQKGGVGKSTLAYNLATYYAKNSVVGIVDADLQGTISDLFASFGEDNKLGGIDLITKPDDYQQLLDMTKYDLLVIDTPPYLSQELPTIFALSDFILIPTKPAVNDYLAIDRTIDFAEECTDANPNIGVGIAINMVVGNSNFTKKIRSQLEKKGVNVLKSEVGQRVEFTRYHLYTDSIFGTNDKKAQEEVTALAKEIFNIIKEQMQ